VKKAVGQFAILLLVKTPTTAAAKEDTL